jgi:hypothetical protein
MNRTLHAAHFSVRLIAWRVCRERRQQGNTSAAARAKNKQTHSTFITLTFCHLMISQQQHPFKILCAEPRAADLFLSLRPCASARELILPTLHGPPFPALGARGGAPLDSPRSEIRARGTEIKVWEKNAENRVEARFDRT